MKISELKYANVPGRKYDADDKAEARLWALQDRKKALLKKLDRISDDFENASLIPSEPEYDASIVDIIISCKRYSR